MRFFASFLEFFREAMLWRDAAHWLTFQPPLTSTRVRTHPQYRGLELPVRWLLCSAAATQVLPARFRLGPYANGPP
jgi:hypothetical protein